MDQKVKELFEKQADLTKIPFVQNELTEKIIDDTGGYGLYNKIEVDLTVAHTDLEVNVSCDRLTVESIDDAVTIKLNSIKNPTIDLQVIPQINGVVKRIYVNNASGSGTLKLLAGSKGMLEFTKKFDILIEPDYIINIVGSYIEAIDGETGEIVKRGTDATTVIQYCIDQLTSGGSICCKAGVYTLTSPGIKIKAKGTDFYGSSMTRTRFELADSSDCNMITVEAAATDCHLHDFRMHGNTTNQASGSGIYTESENFLNLHLNNIYVLYCKDYGIHWQGGDGAAYDVYVEYCDSYSWYITNKRNTFTACSSWLSAKHGFYCADDGNTFTNCITYSNTWDGIRFFQCIDCTWTGGINALNTHNGFSFYGAKNIVVMGAVLYDIGTATNNLYDVFYLDASGGIDCTDNTVIGCQVHSTHANKPKYIIHEVDINQTDNLYALNTAADWVTAFKNSTSASIFHKNMGYLNEAQGVTGNVADGGTFAHGLAATPTGCIISPSVSGELVSVTGLGAANVTVAIKTHAGAAGTAQPLYWRAWV